MLKRLRLYQFQAYKEAELKFHNNLNVILGLPNHGKSSILRSIEFVSKNRPLGDRIHSRFAKKDKETFVELETDQNTVCLNKWSGNEGYYLNKEVFKKFGNSVPNEIYNAINLSEINIQSQLEQHFLVTSNPGEIADTINRITGLDVVDNWISKLTTKINSTNKEIKFLYEQLLSLNSELLNYDNLDIFEIEIKKAERLQLLYNNCKDDVEELTKYIKELESIEKDITRINRILSYENIILNIKNLYKEFADIGDIYNDLDKLVDFYDKIDKYNIYINNICPLFSKIKINMDELNKIKTEIYPLDRDIQELDRIELYLITTIELIVKLELEFENYLNKIKICPVCYAQLTNKRIENILKKSEININ